MENSYTPTVTEGIYPADGGWSEIENQKPSLILSIPDYKNFLNVKINTFDYAWLYDDKLKAYIFCFRINGDRTIEKAIIFQNEHAGILLKDPLIEVPFDLIIVSEPLEELTEQTELLSFQGIVFGDRPPLR